ncbi:Rv3654c family TadE-like protein [Corynebacterium anserum]|uniref:Uncharacterized protein n=1 Tax=Corynebacterium anserum TaxID=2684406 RepID=A0A7G7YQD0_9CORY|nr:Rv3654c family TadE-like protein [Corynebacterium anserum]QNH96700.1 hypothetical protein GP473_08610 [Corynebacterium anserum]
MSTVFGVSCVLSVIAVAGTVAMGTELLLHEQRAEVAADIAAISAATAHAYGNGEACVVAESFVHANGAHMDDCRVDGDDVSVNVTVGIRHAHAVAGPVE